jgi:hypothetical protein
MTICSSSDTQSMCALCTLKQSKPLAVAACSRLWPALSVVSPHNCNRKLSKLCFEYYGLVDIMVFLEYFKLHFNPNVFIIMTKFLHMSIKYHGLEYFVFKYVLIGLM